MNRRSYPGFVRFLVVTRPSRVFVILALVGLILAPSVFTQGGAGNLDPSFGDDGRVTTDFPLDSLFASADRVSSIAIQKDGKIIAVGTAGGRVALARYNLDGSLDAGFGDKGKQAIYLATEIVSVALQSDGMIIAAGYTLDNTSDVNFALIRFNVNGLVDNAFGSSGRIATDLGTVDDRIADIAIQSDGKIVVAGHSLSDIALARYNTDGSLDSTFGSGGTIITDLGGGDLAHAVVIQPDGKIVVAGKTTSNQTLSDFALVRYRSNGRLDPNFGAGGVVRTDFSINHDYAFDLLLQEGNSIVATGHTDNSLRQEDFALARYNEDGSLDESFGSGGKVTTDLFSNSFGPFGSRDAAFAAAAQSNGKIVVVGDSLRTQASERHFVVARYNKDGSLDSSFGAGGKVVTTFLGIFEHGQAIAIQTGGDILVGGETVHSDSSRSADFAIARLDGGGPRINSASIVGKRLLISGERFDDGAVILLDGKKQKTVRDELDPSLLVGKKAGKRIDPGQSVTIQIRNSDGFLSTEFGFSRPQQ